MISFIQSTRMTACVEQTLDHKVLTHNAFEKSAYHDYCKTCLRSVEEANPSCDSQQCCVHGFEERMRKQTTNAADDLLH